MRAVIFTGYIVDLVAVEINNIVDEPVFVAVDKTSVKIVNAIAVCVNKTIVEAVLVCVDKGEVVWIWCEPEVV